MSSRYRLFAAILVAFLDRSLAAADQWVKLATPNFELYTTAGEKKGREAILYFEQVRSFFLEAALRQYLRGASLSGWIAVEKRRASTFW
jgi:hypothetical protein